MTSDGGDVWAIVVAAGSGSRFGARKQFLALGGERLVDRSVRTASDACDGVVVVLPPDETWQGQPVAAIAAGGATRSASVRAGLARVPEAAGVVVVHDAARPLASVDLFRAVVAAVRAGADAAVPGVRVADTIKRVDGDRVIETLPRDELVAVQTPQAFRASALRAAHEAGGDGSDDAALVERSGGTVVVVAGEAANLKATHPADLEVLATLDTGARS